MKRLLIVVLAFSLSLFAAENGENVLPKVWDSGSTEFAGGIWDVLSIGDMDNDGMEEVLICTDEDGTTLYIYECKGNDAWEVVWSYNIAECNYSYTLTTGDLDNNGVDEIIAGVHAGDGQSGIHIFEWDGVDGSDTYTFMTAYDVNGAGGSISSIGCADFDDDGVDELFLGETDTDDLYIVSLDTTSDFSFPNWIIEFTDLLNDEADYSPWGFTYGDFDDDGKVELACSEWDYNGLIVIQVDTVDTYSRELWWDDLSHPNDGATLRSLVSYDLNQDGYSEIIMPSTNQRVYVVQNFGTFVDLDQSSDALDTLTTLDEVTGVAGAAIGNQDTFFGSDTKAGADGMDLYICADGALIDLEYTGGSAGDVTDIANWDKYMLSVDAATEFQHVALGEFDGDGYDELFVVKLNAPYVEVYEMEPLLPAGFEQVVTVDSTGQVLQIRGLCAGSDLDQDGKQEIFITDYRDGHRIHGFEVVADNTLEWVWSSDSLNPSVYAPNRTVVTGDMDNDGNGEIITILRDDSPTEESAAGINIWEWDGTDNGYSIYVHSFIEDGLLGDRYRTEQVQAPADIDGDGRQELLIANNGSDATVGDKFYIVEVAPGGTFESGFYSFNIEASWNDGEHDFQYSPWFGDYGDLDGDGTYEVVFHAWDHGGLFIVDVTGENTYEYVSYLQCDLLRNDGVAYGGTEIADFDGDGRDEVMMPYYNNYSTFVLDVDGALADATVENSVGMVRGPYLGGGLCCATKADFDNDGVWEFYAPNYFSHTYEYDLVGTDPKLAENWNINSVITDLKDNAYGSFAIDAADDLDGDGKGEIVVGYLESGKYAEGGENQIWMKVAEYTGGSMVEKDWKIITPADYKLSQNYPNPFNPTTMINYSLPLAKEVSLTVYDVLGREVKTLVSKKQTAGNYSVQWDGKNAAGEMVSTGTYIYRLKAGHVTKTMTMTLIK